MGLLHRIVARHLQGRKYTRPKNMVPVEDKETERTVYVLPETLQEEGGKYEKIPPSQLNTEGQPAPERRPGQPHLPRKPKKPHRPDITRDPPPAPVHPPIPPKERLPPKKPKPVPPLKPPKVPKPSEPQRWEREERYLHATEQNLRVVQKYLDAL